MRQLPTSPVFTRAEARSLGWTDGSISRAMRSGRLIRVRQGHLSLGTADHLTTAIAAVHACGGSVISHRSALTAHGLPIVGHRSPVPELTVAPRRIGGLLDAHLHRATLPPDDIVMVSGEPTTSVARTLVDVGRSRPIATAVAAMDAALHSRRVTLTELEAVTLRCWNWPGIRRALRSLRLTDGRSESPLESVSRLVIRWIGLPSPRLQAGIFDEFDAFVGRSDFYWDEFGVIGEADGRGKYDGRTVLTREKLRQEEFEQLGAVVVRWGWDDVVRQPRLFRARVERSFERGALRDRSGFRRRWSVGYGKPTM